MYANDRLDGGVESCYEVDPEFLMFTTRGGRCGGNWHTRAVSDRANYQEHKKVPRVNIPSRRRKNYAWIRNKLRDEGLKWLYMKKGCALSVGGPEERTGIDGVEHHLVRDCGMVFVKQNDGNCVTAAINHAVDIVSGRESGEVLREYFDDYNPHYIKIREATLLLRNMAIGAEMRKLPKKDRETFN